MKRLISFLLLASALAYTDAAYPGVHFHTSSSYTSPLPVTIRMKAQVVFY